MDLYTLSDTFIAKDNIDEFVSAIWTERYSMAGDVKLTVEPSQENIDRLLPGTYLALRGSDDVMILESMNIENGLLTAAGRTLVTYLDQRFIWARNPDSSAVGDRVVDYTEDLVVPIKFLRNIVNKMVVTPETFAGAWAPANLTWANEIIPHFEVDPLVGVPDTPAEQKRMTAPIGPLYEGISQIAAKENLGIRVKLTQADEFGYLLTFIPYKGVDRTGPMADPWIRLTPELDSIYDLKEVRSNALHKNVCYVYYKGVITKHLAEPTLPEPVGMARRVVVTSATGEPVVRKTPSTPAGRPGLFHGFAPGMAPWAPPVSSNAGAAYLAGYTGYTNTIAAGAEETAFRDQHAKDIFANANYIRAIDGQTSPQNDYKYGTDYGLGDILELEGLTGTISKVRVTEYIRSQDSTGEKGYPTIAVIP